MSKVIQRAVAECQSAYRKKYSTETAMDVASADGHTVSRWQPFLTDRTQRQSVSCTVGNAQRATGVSSTDLRPVGYTAELSHIIMRHQLKLHQYVDDCRLSK